MGHTVSTRFRVIGTLLVIAAAAIAYQVFSGTGSQPLDQSSFYDAVAEGQVEAVTIAADSIGYEIRGLAQLEERAETLTRVAEALLLHETLAAEQIATLVRGEPLQLTPQTSADSREQIEAARQGEEAHFPLLPEPGPQPA